jgi:hypothetical protein
VVICNDSEDHVALKSKLDGYDDPRIRFYPNEKNLGYPLNIRRCTELATRPFLFLMGQDDLILGQEVFAKFLDVFKKNKRVGVITRPYFWFDSDPTKPIRVVPLYHQRIICYDDSERTLRALLDTLGQLSGLMYRKELITHEFNEHVFPAHIYPFLSVLKTHGAYYWQDFTIAVRTSSSQTRFVSSIYHPSPTKTWMDMFHEVFPEDKFEGIRNIGIDHMGQNYVGLAQIRNYGYYKDLVSDIYYLVRYRPKNLLSPLFWVFAIGSLVIPKTILRMAVDRFKNGFLKRKLNSENLLVVTPPVAARRS